MTENWLRRVFARKRENSEAFLSAELREMYPVDVNFGNGVELAGLRLTRDAGGVALKLHWRALRKNHRPWRCFAHVLAGDAQISSLDHDILGGRPAITSWEPGDEAYERLYLWLQSLPQNLRLRLGVYDPEINVRSAVLASTLPVTDEGSAVWVAPDCSPGTSYYVKFDPLPLTPCRVDFEDGLELTAYSLARHSELVWLRLKWTVRRGERRTLRFFGHATAEAVPGGPAAAQFDQDVAVERRGPVTVVEQNIVRVLAPSGAGLGFLRAGLAGLPALVRLAIRASTFPFDVENRCFYIEFPETVRRGAVRGLPAS